MIHYLKQWLVSLKHYALMCVLISGPDRLPSGVQNIVLSLFCYCLIGFALVDTQRSYPTILQQIVLELLLLAVVCYAGLKWKNLLPRFTQTFSALIGVNIIISIVSIPLYRVLVSENELDSGISSTALNATMLIVFWNLAVMSLIFKKAFNINTLLAAMISFNYFLVFQFIVVWFF
jgi:hypothetical protein